MTTYPHDVFLNSQPLEAGTSFEEWFEAYDQLQRTWFSNCNIDDGYETTTVTASTGDRLRMFDQVDVRINTAVCGGSRWAEALWAHGDQVYSLRVGEDPDAALPIVPREEIEIWLDRITLDPVAP